MAFCVYQDVSHAYLVCRTATLQFQPSLDYIIASMMADTWLCRLVFASQLPSNSSLLLLCGMPSWLEALLVQS